MNVLRDPGCPAYAKVERDYYFTIPSHEPYTQMSLPTSFQGKLISVIYTLKVFVKHKAWNDFGEGNFIVLPIKICSATAENQVIEYSPMQVE